MAFDVLTHDSIERMRKLFRDSTGRDVDVVLVAPRSKEQLRAAGWPICKHCDEVIAINNYNNNVHSQCVGPYIEALEVKIAELEGSNG